MEHPGAATLTSGMASGQLNPLPSGFIAVWVRTKHRVAATRDGQFSRFSPSDIHRRAGLPQELPVLVGLQPWNHDRPAIHTESPEIHKAHDPDTDNRFNQDNDVFHLPESG